jgi:hypothetical protein
VTQYVPISTSIIPVGVRTQPKIQRHLHSSSLTGITKTTSPLPHWLMAWMGHPQKDGPDHTVRCSTGTWCVCMFTWFLFRWRWISKFFPPIFNVMSPDSRLSLALFVWFTTEECYVGGSPLIWAATIWTRNKNEESDFCLLATNFSAVFFRTSLS